MVRPSHVFIFSSSLLLSMKWQGMAGGGNSKENTSLDKKNTHWFQVFSSSFVGSRYTSLWPLASRVLLVSTCSLPRGAPVFQAVPQYLPPTPTLCHAGLSFWWADQRGSALLTTFLSCSFHFIPTWWGCSALLGLLFLLVPLVPQKHQQYEGLSRFSRVFSI